MWLRIQPRGFLDFALDPSHPLYPGPAVKLEPDYAQQILAPLPRHQRTFYKLEAPVVVRYEPDYSRQTLVPSRRRHSRKALYKLYPPTVLKVPYPGIRIRNTPNYRLISYRPTPFFIKPVIVSPLPRIEIPVADITHSGTQPLAQINSDSLYNHYFANDGNVYLEVYNANASTQSVTIISSAMVDELTVADVTVSLTTGQTKLIGPFNKYVFNQLIPGNPTGFTYVWVDVSVSTDLKLRAYRLP